MQETDALKILSSTKPVVEQARFVLIEDRAIPKIASLVLERIERGLGSPSEAFATTGVFDDDLQLVFLQDVVNFCFWTMPGRKKWQVEWSKGRTPHGGWYGLRLAFLRALGGKKPILNASYLSDIPLSDVAEIFEGADGVQIPLVGERQQNLQEAGRVLLEKFEGHFQNILEEANYDAVKLVEMIIDSFSSFRDIDMLERKDVFFFKRAQIAVYDISLLLELYSKQKLSGLEQLTAFADYKLPQVLREYEVLSYVQSLAEKVDTYTLLPKGSREEIEIRAATIWAVESIRQTIKGPTACKIDNALWLIGQDLSPTARPYHRTRTIYY